jgi:hypothetical protein
MWHFTAPRLGANKKPLKIARFWCYFWRMSFDKFIDHVAEDPGMKWLLKVTDPLHKPIGDDKHVTNFWLRLSTWRAAAVMLAVAFVLGWIILPNIIWWVIHNLLAIT